MQLLQMLKNRIAAPLEHVAMRQPLMLFLLQSSSKKGNVYNILWALVFGFATLNILALVVRRSDSGRSRLSMGEVLAIMVVCVSVLLLGWEMLNILKIFPIKLQPRE
ncbi:MAG: hypothetical protein QOJ41_1680, partial [Acidobacteriaceae bacterium]|jgi:hypothetical protein|nr:hypothetical protein [Acidobacteriaceae bacterium]